MQVDDALIVHGQAQGHVPQDAIGMQPFAEFVHLSIAQRLPKRHRNRWACHLATPRRAVLLGKCTRQR